MLTTPQKKPNASSRLSRVAMQHGGGTATLLLRWHALKYGRDSSSTTAMTRRAGRAEQRRRRAGKGRGRERRMAATGCFINKMQPLRGHTDYNTSPLEAQFWASLVLIRVVYQIAREGAHYMCR